MWWIYLQALFAEMNCSLMINKLEGNADPIVPVGFAFNPLVKVPLLNTINERERDEV